MRHKLISFCLVILTFLMIPSAAFALNFSEERKGSISITLADPNGATPIVGAELSLYHVATVGRNNSFNLAYVINDEFKDCGIDLNDSQLVSKLDALLEEKNFASQTLVTDSHGEVLYDNLPTGLYFVKQSNTVSGYAPCSSFLVTLPEESADGYNYAVNASPKTEVERLVDITMKKVWNTGTSGKATASVKVQLLRDDVVLETAVLSAANNWQITYKDMPQSDKYSIKELDVPKGFTASYSQKDFVFTVTNTSSLAQTGQLVWPIPVLALAGLVLIAAGVVFLRKSRNNNA